MRYLAKLEEAKKKKGRCWTGYKPKAGSVPYSKGSCVKEAYKLIGLSLIEAKKRPYTKEQVFAYARGREEATFARRKKELADFYKPKDEPKETPKKKP